MNRQKAGKRNGQRWRRQRQRQRRGKKCLMECNERFLLSRTKEFIVLYDDTR